MRVICIGGPRHNTWLEVEKGLPIIQFPENIEGWITSYSPTEPNRLTYVFSIYRMIAPGVYAWEGNEYRD